MSAQFFLEYAGAPVRFSSAGVQLVTEAQADRFVSEADVWLTAHAHGLNPGHCRVVNLYLQNTSPQPSPHGGEGGGSI